MISNTTMGSTASSGTYSATSFVALNFYGIFWLVMCLAMALPLVAVYVFSPPVQLLDMLFSSVTISAKDKQATKSVSFKRLFLIGSFVALTMLYGSKHWNFTSHVVHILAKTAYNATFAN